MFDTTSKDFKVVTEDNNTKILSTKEGIWTFLKEATKIVKRPSCNTYVISLLIICSLRFPLNKEINTLESLPLMEKWINIPKRFYRSSYNDIKPYAKKLLSQDRYPVYFRVFFETFLEHEPFSCDSLLDTVLAVCPFSQAVFNYVNMGMFQLYCREDAEDDLNKKDIWEHMRMNFIYFLKVSQLELAYSRYCEYQLLNKSAFETKKKRGKKDKKKKQFNAYDLSLQELAESLGRLVQQNIGKSTRNIINHEIQTLQNIRNIKKEKSQRRNNSKDQEKLKLDLSLTGCLGCGGNADLRCCDQISYCHSCAQKLVGSLHIVKCWICKKILLI